MLSINFVKITAAGNDFIMIDNRRGKIKLSPSAIKKICSRKFGVGADGLIFLENSKDADFKMRYFNSDGSRASMCGNGARSIARFARYVGAVNKDKGHFRSDAGLIGYEFLENNLIKVELPQPRDAKVDFNLSVDGNTLVVSFINTSVPHVVIFPSENRKQFPVNFDDMKITELGRAIRFHKKFSPSGTNVNFVKVAQHCQPFAIKVRTYERGVEDETFACGTGATASAIVAGIKNLVTPPVKVLTRGGDILEVDYDLIRPTPSARRKIRANFLPRIKNVYLGGPADIVFAGCISV